MYAKTVNQSGLFVAKFGIKSLIAMQRLCENRKIFILWQQQQQKKYRTQQQQFTENFTCKTVRNIDVVYNNI